MDPRGLIPTQRCFPVDPRLDQEIYLESCCSTLQQTRLRLFCLATCSFIFPARRFHTRQVVPNLRLSTVQPMLNIPHLFTQVNDVTVYWTLDSILLCIFIIIITGHYHTLMPWLISCFHQIWLDLQVTPLEPSIFPLIINKQTHRNPRKC